MECDELFRREPAPLGPLSVERMLRKRSGILSTFPSQLRKVTTCTLHCDHLLFVLFSSLSLPAFSLSLSFFLHIFISSPLLRSRASFLSLRATNLAFTLYYCSVELVLCPCFTCMCMCTCSSHLYMPLFYEKPTRVIFVFPYLLLLTHKVCRCGRHRFNRIPAIHISAG